MLGIIHYQREEWLLYGKWCVQCASAMPSKAVPNLGTQRQISVRAENANYRVNIKQNKCVRFGIEFHHAVSWCIVQDTLSINATRKAISLCRNLLVEIHSWE